MHDEIYIFVGKQSSGLCGGGGLVLTVVVVKKHKLVLTSYVSIGSKVSGQLPVAQL